MFVHTVIDGTSALGCHFRFMGKNTRVESIIQQRQIQYEKYLDYEAYHLEQQRRITDEITDASEKLAAPMQNTFSYDMGSDGELWFQGQAFGPILDKSVAQASSIASRYPKFRVELIRRQIERQEYDEQRRLALGSENDPDTLVVLSPLPDAVIGGADLGAYDLERKVTMVRIYKRTANGIEATSLSLDKSDRNGLNAIAEIFGQSIADNESSEEILARRFWANQQDFHGRSVSQVVRQAYDQSLASRYGGVWYAGRQDSPVLNTKIFIEQQLDLVNEHIKIINLISSEDNITLRQQLLEEARYNFVAALDRRLRGKTDLASEGRDILGAAGDRAKQEGREYKNNCPSMDMSVEESAIELGLGLDFFQEQVFVSKQCPLCGEKNVTTRRKGEMISGSCGCWREICSGRSYINRQDVVARLSKLDKTVTKKPISIQDMIRRRYGESAIIKSVLVIGGTRDLIIDMDTGEQLAEA